MKTDIQGECYVTMMAEMQGKEPRRWTENTRSSGDGEAGRDTPQVSEGAWPCWHGLQTSILQNPDTVKCPGFKLPFL